MKLIKYLIFFLLLPVHSYAQEKDTFELAPDFNLRLKYLADSSMIIWFGEIGFKNNFTMACLQNPCKTGSFYGNHTTISDTPCATEPQDSCKEAIITYNHVKEGVPLILKMMVSLTENGEFVYLQEYIFGGNKFTLEQQNILSLYEIQEIINNQFSDDDLKLLTYPNAITYSNSRLQKPSVAADSPKLLEDPGYRLIKESAAGKNWKGGFIYTAFTTDPRKLQKHYYFDATTGELLWITEIYNH
ncbi:MAG: hypothetical protein RIQ90_745 [Bacteroidota bacterium]|jgi:hypothetical protein